MKKALRRLIVYAFLLAEFISSAAFALTVSPYRANILPPDFEVDSISPKKGPAWGGTIITIYGKKFLPNSVFEVKFGGIPGTKVTRVDNQTLRVKSPRFPLMNLNADTLEVTVTEITESPNVTKVSPDSFIYLRPGTKLNLLPASALYNGNVELNAILTDSLNNPVDSQMVAFTLGGLSVGTVLTDTTGLAKLSVPISNVKPGVHAGYIGANFQENFYYKSSNFAQADLTVKPVQVTLSLNNPVVNFGESIELKALLMLSGSPLIGKTVTFYLNNNAIGSEVTQNDGSAALHYSQLPDAGQYNIKAVFAEQGFDTTSAAGILTVNQLPTSISVEKVETSPGSTVSLTATLTANGAPVKSQTITFTIDGSIQAGTQTTNDLGVATLGGVNLGTLGIGPGTHIIGAGFAGSTNYKTSSASNELIVSQEATEITTSNLEADYGSTVKLSAKLTSKTTGFGIKDAVINFEIEGGPQVESGVTDGNGEASKSVNLGNTSPGTHKITISFAGNGSYGPSHALVTLTVKQAPNATEIQVEKSTGDYGGKTTLSARLMASGSGLGGMTLHFKLKGENIGETQTNSDGLAQLHGVSIAGIDAGLHENFIEVSFSPSNGGYLPSSGKGALEVSKAPTSISANNADAEFGSTITLTATLISSVTGNGISGETVNFTIEDGPVVESAQTNSGGVATKSVSLGNTSPGKHNIHVSFGGSANYVSSQKTVSLTVTQTQIATTLSVSSASGSYGGSVNLHATLKSGNSNLAGQTIKFYLKDVLVGENVTGNDGVANYIAPLGSIDAGTYPTGVKAEYVGSNAYAASSAQNSLIVSQASTILSVLDAEAYYGSSVTLSAILTSSVTQSGIADKPVSFIIQGGPQATAVTNGSGVATVKVDLGNTSAGTHDITAAFAPSGGNYSGSTAKGKLSVNGFATSLTVTDLIGNYGGTVTLEATLYSSGAGLQGKTIKFTFNNKSYSAETNLSGVARVAEVSIAGFEVGTHYGVILAEFAGTGGYAYSSASGNLTVDKAATAIAVANATGSSGGKVDLSATLTSGSSKLKGLTVRFQLNNSPAGEAKTNELGVATLYGVTLQENLTPGPHPGAIAAVFDGNDNYMPVQGSGTLTVTQTPTIIVVTKATGSYGGKVNLAAKLSSSSGSPLNSMKLHFKLKGADLNDIYTDENGLALLSGVSIAGIDAGYYENYIEVSFSSVNSNYAPSTGYGSLEVIPAATKISISDMDAGFGSTITLSAKLTSVVTGNGIENRTIVFKIDGSEVQNGTTGADGKAVKNYYLGNTSPGNHTLEAFYSPASGGNYSGSSGKATLKVKAASTSLVVTNVTGTYGGTVTLEATLTSGEYTLTGRTISFKLNGAFVGNASTGTNGVATLQGVSLSAINAGTYNGIIEAYFAASGNYSSSTGYGNLTVKQAPTTTVVQKATGSFNGKANLTARLTASLTGNALSGRTLYFRLNGLDKGSAVTDNDGVASLADVNIAGLSVGIYNDYIEAVFSPSGGNFLPSSGKGPLEVGLATTNLKLEKVTAAFGSKVTLTATLTSQGIPLSGKLIEFSLNNKSVGTALTDANGIAVKTNVDLTGIPAGIYPGYIGASFAEANPFKGCSNKADLEVKKAATAVTVLPAEVQYSDQVTLTAVVISAVQEVLNSSGGKVEFKYQVGSETAVSLGVVTSYSVVNGKLNFKYTFTCTLAPNTYKILAVFTPSDQADFDYSCNIAPWGPLVVKPEDALAEYSGVRYFSATSLSAYSALLTYSSTLTDYPDAFRGNISNARAELREVQTGELYDQGIVRGTNLPVFLFNSSDQTLGGVTTQSFNRKLGQSEINKCGTTFTVYTSVYGYYHALSDPALVSVCIPSTENISGGGFIISNSPSGKYRCLSGSKTSFGFSMKYNKSGKDAQGQVNIIIHAEDNKIYQVTANIINVLSAYLIKDLPGKAASFTTKADFRDITDPSKPIFLGGGLTLKLEIYDDEKYNEKDAIAITLQDINSALLFSSNWDGTKTVSQSLKAPKGGGNIMVLSVDDPVGVEEEEIVPKEFTLYQNYPNPFNPSTNIQFDLPEESRVSIVIYNILGREVARVVDKDFPAGRHQAVWNSQNGSGTFASGIYILRISAKSLSSEKSLISTKKMMLVK
ncbi:MAG: Ig-like domain repeat protein [Acidobacteriota bacterium]